MEDKQYNDNVNTNNPKEPIRTPRLAEDDLAQTFRKAMDDDNITDSGMNGVEKEPKEPREQGTRRLDDPFTPPPQLPNTNDSEDDKDTKDDLKSVKSRVIRKLAVAQDMILDKVEAMLLETDPEKQPTLNQLINALATIADIRLTQEWTERLRKAIERNPTNLTAPNVPAPLLNRLKGLAGATRKQGKGDGREGRVKMGSDVPNDLPD